MKKMEIRGGETDGETRIEKPRSQSRRPGGNPAQRKKQGDSVG